MLRFFPLCLSVSLLCTTAIAFAAKNFEHTESHLSPNSPAKVEAILRDYGNYCDHGCRYSRPNLVKIRLLDYKKSDTSWYTWTYVSTTFKDVKYFTHVQLNRKKDGAFHWQSQQVKDPQLLRTLKAKTGLDHKPAFVGGSTSITAVKQGSGTKFTQHVVVEADGFLARFPGKIIAGIKKSFRWTFHNIDL